MMNTSLAEDILYLEHFLTPELSRDLLSLVPAALSGDTSYAGKTVTLTPEVTKKLHLKLVEQNIDFQRILLARLRVTTAADYGTYRSFIHTDHDCRKALVVYVENNLFEADEDAGTLFWEHRVTSARKIGEKNSRARLLHTMVLERDSSDLSHWLNWLSSPFQQDAAVLFDSLYFHSPPLPDSPRKQQGRRITLDIFLD